MARNFRANFVRKRIRADYHLDDRLLGPVSDARGNGVDARCYLQLDQTKRIKLIAGRALRVLIHGFAVVALVRMAVLLLVRHLSLPGGPFSRGDSMEALLVIVAVLLLGCLFFGFALKSYSWLRWMARNWNAPVLKRRRITPKNRSAETSRSSAKLPRVRPADAFDIARAWFLGEFVRKYVLAKYQPGDSLLIGGGWSLFNRWYPEEYLSSTKGGRAIMIVSTAPGLVLALYIAYMLRPSVLSAATPVPGGWFFSGLVLTVTWWALITTQGFLRWMLCNWNAERRGGAD